jgi:uncharacterized membrane protein YfcA
MPYRWLLSEMKFIIDAMMLSLLYIGGVIALNTDLTYIVTIAGASIAGSVVLAYFRRDRDHREIFFKAACSSLCGLVTGAVITKRWEITAVEYVIAVYFSASLLSLFFIKGLLSFTEQNAQGLIVTILQRIINPQNGRLLPSVTPDDTVPPNNRGQVIQTDVIVTKVPADEISDQGTAGSEK